VCTEKSIQLETKRIQPGGVLPKNLGCMILGRQVDPGWRMTPAKFALFSGESTFRYTQDIRLPLRRLVRRLVLQNLAGGGYLEPHRAGRVSGARVPEIVDHARPLLEPFTCRERAVPLPVDLQDDGTLDDVDESWRRMRVKASLGGRLDLGHPHVSLIAPGGVGLKHGHASHRLRRHNR
jgi:hypothetical protein